MKVVDLYTTSAWASLAVAAYIACRQAFNPYNWVYYHFVIHGKSNFCRLTHLYKNLIHHEHYLCKSS